jgi:hypothetical protein
MNAVEIEQAISDLALQPFDAAEFPFAFLAAFGNKDTTLKRLRAGNNNTSDLPGGVLQRNNIHIVVCQPGTTSAGLVALRSSPATAKGKAKFTLATDGQTLEAEDLAAGEVIACDYPDFPDHFGFFLPLAGISTVKEIKDNPIDVRATGRLNKLYVELLRENPDWAMAERRADMNHFMARLIFCFFAEDTDIFNGEALFTRTLEQMSDRDAGNLLLDRDELETLGLSSAQRKRFIRRIYGAHDLINETTRFCVWIEDEFLEDAQQIPALRSRIDAVRELRLASPDKGARTVLAMRPHQMKLMRIGRKQTLIIPIHTSENRPYLPIGLTDSESTLTNATYGLYDAPLWNMALIASRLHLIWIATVCGKLKTDFRYSNTLGWNTFPVPPLTEQNKADLTRCAENILLAREAHFPATIAELYDPETMPDNLRQAHAHNDEVLERIYIGRRFKNDTERLEKLFELYTKMTAAAAARTPAKSAPKKRSKERV